MKFNLRNVMFALIIIVCIFALNYGVYWQFFRDSGTEQNEIGNTIRTDVDTESLAINFKNIFNNTLNYQGYNINTTGVTKIDSDKDLVYTLYEKEEISENKYDINIKIPYINISNDSVEKFNKQIDEIFVAKAENIIAGGVNNTIYDVEYMSYINTNILSLVIKSTLKEGNNPQRVIVQTYNYNLSTNEVIDLNRIIEIQGLNVNYVRSKINETVEQANSEAMSLKSLGYNVFVRDLQSDIYEIENTTTFFIGENNRLYVIYPYGNANFTDAMDVVVF